MPAADHARNLDRADALERLPIDDRDFVAVADVQELLIAIRRQREIPGERRRRLHQLLDELSIGGEHLDAAVLAVGYVDHPVLRHADRVYGAEVLRTGTIRN